MSVLALHQLTERAQDAIEAYQREAETQACIAWCCSVCRETEADCTCGEAGPETVMVDL